jgi:fatty-acyl-CoA synthase
MVQHNGPEYVETVFACLKLRALPVGVNPRSGPAELAHIVADCGAEVVVFHRSLDAVVDAALARLPRVRVLVAVDDRGDRPEDGSAPASADRAVDHDELLASHAPAARIERHGTDALLWYTGGTTGTPKGVVWHQQTLLTFELAYVASLLGTEAPTTLGELADAAVARDADGHRLVSLVTTPLAHATAANQFHLALANGGALVVLPPGRVDGDEICRTVARERVRLLSVVGEVVLRRVVDALERAAAAGTPYDLSSLWRIHSSGTTTRAATKDALHAHAPGVELYDSLGATEGVGFAAVRTRHGDAPDSRFRLGPNARVLDDDDRDVEPGSGAAGVLAVAVSTAVCYHGDAERSAATFRDVDGVRHAVLGDVAVPHPDGTITLLGRGTQCINTGGEKVWPEEVEDALAEHPAVVDAAVAGVPDDEWGEVVGAVVALRADAGPDAPDAEALGAWVTERLARYKRPRRVVFVAAVRRTAVGKTDRGWARDQLLT